MSGFFGFVAFVTLLTLGLNVAGIVPLMFLSGAFLFGTLGFWALVVLESLILVSLLEFDERNGTGIWATVSLVVTLLLLQQFGDVKILSAAWSHPLNAALWVLGYFVTGTLWSLAKWWFFLRNKRERYDAIKREFLRTKNITGDAIPNNLKNDWTQRVNSYYRQYPPEVSRHKSLILMWMTYWPWSAAWTLVNDPVKRLFNEIFAQLSKVYETMRDRAFRGTENDFAKNVKDEDD